MVCLEFWHFVWTKQRGLAWLGGLALQLAFHGRGQHAYPTTPLTFDFNTNKLPSPIFVFRAQRTRINTSKKDS